MSVAFLSGGSAGLEVKNVVIDPASVAANTTARQTFTVAGLKVTDFVQVSKPTLNAGLGVVGATVSAANTLAITFVNATAGAIDAASEIWRVAIIRPV